MNEEQNNPGNSEEISETANLTPGTTGGTPEQPAVGSDNAEQDDYYDVDHSKKDVITTIGDGEMQNEGLAGAEDTDLPADNDL